MGWLFGKPKKKTSYGIKAEKGAEEYLKKKIQSSFYG
jgi:hypothetical protein